MHVAELDLGRHRLFHRAAPRKSKKLRRLHKTVASCGEALIPAALSAVLQWKYEPTSLNGESVSVELQVRVSFNPHKGECTPGRWGS